MMSNLLTALRAAGKGPANMVWIELCGMTPQMIQGQFDDMYERAKKFQKGFAEAMMWAYLPTSRQVSILYPAGVNQPSSHASLVLGGACLKWTHDHRSVLIPESEFDQLHAEVRSGLAESDRLRTVVGNVLNGPTTVAERQSGKGLFLLLVERLFAAGFMQKEQADALRASVENRNFGPNAVNALNALAVAATVLNQRGGIVVGAYAVVLNDMTDGGRPQVGFYGHSDMPIDWHALADSFDAPVLPDGVTIEDEDSANEGGDTDN